MRAAGPVFCRLAFSFSSSVRRGTRANARRILGEHSTRAQQDDLARGVLASFYFFCCELARNFDSPREKLLTQIESVEGESKYLEARALGKGVIVLTAHMGSFEIALSALRTIEEKITVVFRRDAVGGFEKIRSTVRRNLQIQEAALDDGWPVWLRLRNALQAGETVVMQGDRVMPDQKGIAIEFLGGHIELPAGPAKLALAAGSPIVPIFCIGTDSGRIRLFVEPPIHVENGDVDAVIRQFGAVLEKFVKAHPGQWLMLQPVLIEDRKIS